MTKTKGSLLSVEIKAIFWNSLLEQSDEGWWLIAAWCNLKFKTSS
jgi:hypothetical protein